MQKHVKTYSDIDKIWGERSRSKHLLALWWNIKVFLDHHEHPWEAVSGPSVPPRPALITCDFTSMKQQKHTGVTFMSPGEEENWRRMESFPLLIRFWALPCFEVVCLSNLSETQESALNKQTVFALVLYNSLINLLLL